MRFSVSSSAVALILNTIILLSQAELYEDWPAYRFIEWGSLLTDDQDHATALTYDESSWNVPGTLLQSPGIESKSFERLSEFEQSQAREIGLTEDVWDCYQNHFNDYSWAELKEEGLDASFETLGWTEDMWDDTVGSTVPDSDDKDYSSLSLKEKLALEDVCYFQANWDMEELSDYPNGAPDSPSSAFGLAVTTTMLVVGAASAAMVL